MKLKQFFSAAAVFMNFPIFMFVSCLSQQDYCYYRLENFGGKGVCELFAAMALSTDNQTISNAALLQCAVVYQEDQECKKKSKIIPGVILSW
ncbi:MAG: hypothetical protein OEZ34_15760 [Spirochaetia bacterium]|nr:hypothetical protein [Spirochaetia bacterium]